MALHTQIASNDCIQEYETAAHEHQDAGLALLADGYAQGVALMALAAEMLLKAAYFRFIGYAPTQTIAKTDLRDSEVDIHGLGVLQSAEGYHNLLFWAEAIIAARRQGLPIRSQGSTRLYSAVAARPMSHPDELELLRCAFRLKTNWSIGDRYRSMQPYASKQDLEDVFDDAVEIARLYHSGKV